MVIKAIILKNNNTVNLLDHMMGVAKEDVEKINRWNIKYSTCNHRQSQ